MISMLIWIFGIGISVSIMIVTAATAMPLANMAVAAIVSSAIALLAIRENRAMHAAGAHPSAVAASTARHMGLVWCWGALVLFAVYYFILKWSEWLPFFLAFAAAGVLCLLISTTLARDAAAGREDPSMSKIARILTQVQLVGMVIAVIGLLVDGKMTRYLTPRFTDWAANNVFFFGAAALAAISLNALMTSRSKTVAG